MVKFFKIITPFLVKFIPETRFFGLKRMLYRLSGCTIGKNTKICSSARIFATGQVIIGKNVWIGPEAIVSSSGSGKIILEDYCRIGMRVIVVNGFHEITPDGDCIEGKGTQQDIILGKGCAVSTMSIVLPGKNIGEMAHVAAGSVVTKHVEPFTQVAGVPARVLKNLRT